MGLCRPFTAWITLLHDLPGAARTSSRFALGFHLSDFQPLKMVRRALRGVPASARISIHRPDVIIPGRMTMQSALSGLPKEKVLPFSVRAACDGVRIGPAT